MPEQNGLDILIDAAGSDLLLSPPPPPPPPPRAKKARTSKPSKRSEASSYSSPADLVCHICQRVYERADHLTRHLRAHENARPYQCGRCEKRFNRA
ncbi:unnamed protein product [Discula destructiva]